MFFGAIRLAKAGMPPPPARTLAAISAGASCNGSRFGPDVPVEPAAVSVWHVPQPALLQTTAPVASSVVGCDGVLSTFAARLMSPASALPAPLTGSIARRNRGSYVT